MAKGQMRSNREKKKPKADWNKKKAKGAAPSSFESRLAASSQQNNGKKYS